MADIKHLFPFIMRWEGGFVNHPADPGGATNKGVILATFKQHGFDNDGDGDIDVNDLIKITDAQAMQIMKKHYWDRWRADEIKSQSIANTLVDWVWGSGSWGIIIPQRLLGVKADGIVGPITLAALNKQDPQDFLLRLYRARYKYLADIVALNPRLRVFSKGWDNRMRDLEKLNKKF